MGKKGKKTAKPAHHLQKDKSSRKKPSHHLQEQPASSQSHAQQVAASAAHTSKHPPQDIPPPSPPPPEHQAPPSPRPSLSTSEDTNDVEARENGDWVTDLETHDSPSATNGRAGRADSDNGIAGSSPAAAVSGSMSSRLGWFLRPPRGAKPQQQQQRGDSPVQIDTCGSDEKESQKGHGGGDGDSGKGGVRAKGGGQSLSPGSRTEPSTSSAAAAGNVDLGDEQYEWEYVSSEGDEPAK